MRSATFTHRRPADTPERRAGADQRFSLAELAPAAVAVNPCLAPPGDGLRRSKVASSFHSSSGSRPHPFAEVATAHAIADALSSKVGKPLPWVTVRAAFDGACQGRLLERTVDSGPWPCDFTEVQGVKLRVPEKRSTTDLQKLKDETPGARTGVLVAVSYVKVSEIQEFADQIGDISNAAVGSELKVKVRIEVGGDGKRPPEEVVAKINSKLGEVSKNLKLG